MSGRTSHYGWTTMQGGDSFSDNGYKYTGVDRKDIDAKTWLGAEGHRHLGGTIAVTSPSGPPVLNRSTSGGLIPAGTRCYYRIALVNVRNEESVASAEAFIDTPAAVVEPSGATLTYTASGGALLGGDYYYALSAYTGITTNETRAIGTTFISVNSITGTNKVTLAFPSLPAGATGFNIYRRAPGETKYFHLVSVDMNVATPPTGYVDNGSVAENCDRTVPNANTTNATNSVRITYPGATPVVPSGYTWRIYRTFLSGNYAQSLLVNVIEFTNEATPVITTTYLDTGIPTSSGEPLTVAPVLTNPSKILLTDGAEVQGVLPPSFAPTKRSKEFEVTGLLTVSTGLYAWRCPYDTFLITEVFANLGRGSLAASTAVIVDVNKYDHNTTTWATIFTTQANRPRIAVGDWIGASAVPDVVILRKNDFLSVDIDQTGGGATPTDRDLNVEVVGYAFDDTTTSVTEP